VRPNNNNNNNMSSSPLFSFDIKWKKILEETEKEFKGLISWLPNYIMDIGHVSN